MWLGRTNTGFREADWILASAYPLGFFFGIGAFVSFTRDLVGSPFLTILHTVWTDGRDAADVEVEAITGQWKKGGSQTGLQISIC